MLNYKEKIDFLAEYLSLKNKNYADLIKEELYIQIFDFENISSQFLEKIKTKQEIIDKIEFVVSKVVLHEHETGINNIISEYL